MKMLRPRSPFLRGYHVRYLLALGAVHRHRGGEPDRAQCGAARAHGDARHGGRDPCALPVRVSVRAGLLRRRADRERGAAAAPAGDLLGLGARRRAHADRRDRADACRHERPLVRGGLRLYQDRAGAGRAVRAGLPRRRGDAGHGGRDPDRDRGRRDHGAQARPPMGSRRRCSGLPPARCSRSRRSVFAARS